MMSIKTRTKLTSILLLNFFQFCLAQDCILNIGEFTKQIDYKLDTINEAEFTQIESNFHIHDSIYIKPFSEAEFLSQYPNIFEKTENGYKFKTLDDNFIHVSNFDTIEKSQEFHQYKFLGKYCDFAIIYKIGYESWSYLYVNLNDGRVFSTEGKPNTNNCEFIYSTSNYYGEGMFEVIDILNKRKLSLYFDLWDAEKVINIDHEYYLKLNYFGQCHKSTQYIKINLQLTTDD